MKDSRKKNLCLWIVRENAKVTKVRLTYFRIAIFAMFFALVGGSLVLVAGDYTRVQVLRFKNYVLLKKVEQERDSLAQSKISLEGQLEGLRVLNSKVMAYEQDVRQKLVQLGQVIESATSLGVVEEDQNSATAEPLEGGVGGPELDCTSGVGGEKCPLRLMADAGIRAQLNPAGFIGAPNLLSNDKQLARLTKEESRVPLFEEDDNLLGRLDRYVEFLNGLPLGTPAKGKLTSGYGYRISPFTKHLSLREGVDISLSQGATIKCTGKGIVRQVVSNPTYGLMVDVEHSDHFITRYAHLSKALVAENDKVVIGDVIGLAGSTGRSTGPHLHYEVRVDGRAKNPKNFLGLVNSLRAFL